VAIEIRELVIRAVVDPGPESRSPVVEPARSPTDEIVAECVEQVLDILRLRQER
jgi:hypothetical protein